MVTYTSIKSHNILLKRAFCMQGERGMDGPQGPMGPTGTGVQGVQVSGHWGKSKYPAFGSVQ